MAGARSAGEEYMMYDCVVGNVSDTGAGLLSVLLSSCWFDTLAVDVQYF